MNGYAGAYSVFVDAIVELHENGRSPSEIAQFLRWDGFGGASDFPSAAMVRYIAAQILGRQCRWLPKVDADTSRDRLERDGQIFEDVRDGATYLECASKLNITSARVMQIYWREHEKRSPTPSHWRGSRSGGKRGGPSPWHDWDAEQQEREIVESYKAGFVPCDLTPPSSEA